MEICDLPQLIDLARGGGGEGRERSKFGIVEMLRTSFSFHPTPNPTPIPRAITLLVWYTLSEFGLGWPLCAKSLCPFFSPLSCSVDLFFFSHHLSSFLLAVYYM